MNFQAAVTALVNVYLARGRPLGWLDGQVDDVPVSLLAETGGSGDDLQVRYRDDSVAEVQIKRGLSVGERLWGTLLKLSGAIYAEDINYGILIVSPDSSRTITNALSRDVKRINDVTRIRAETSRPGHAVGAIVVHVELHTMRLS